MAYYTGKCFKVFTQNKVTGEYTVLRGVFDSPDHAVTLQHELAAMDEDSLCEGWQWQETCIERHKVLAKAEAMRAKLAQRLRKGHKP